MYKVFFKDRIVFLTDNIERDLSIEFGAIFKYSNPKELDDFISQFIQKEEIKKAYIYHHNLDELFQLFSNHFKNINAAGGLVFNKKNQLLFIHRMGVWDLPKGKAEKGESIEETALREVEEECGLTHLNIIKPLPNTYHTYLHKGEMVLKTTYWYQMEYLLDETPTPQLEEDITEVSWKYTSEIPEVMKNTYASISEILKKYLP